MLINVCIYDKPDPTVLPIIPYPKFIPIIVKLFPSHHLLCLCYSLNFSASAHGYIVVDKFKIDIILSETLLNSS